MIEIAQNDSLECFPAKKGSNIVGIAIKSYSKKGFSGEVWVMVGFKPDGSIKNTSVLDHKETPGLGDKMQKSKSDWSNQFNGIIPIFNSDNSPKNIKVKKDGGQIDAITASTISSRAFCDAINRASIAFSKIKK
jgi:electron transport complex protein RnfG